VSDGTPASRQAASARRSTKAAGDDKVFSGDPRRIRGREEHSGWGDVLHLSDAAQGGLRFELLAKITLVQSGGTDAFGLDHAGIDGVDPDVSRPKFLRKGAGDRVNRSLGRAVNRRVRRRQRAGARADVDYTAAVRSKVFDRCLCRQQQAKRGQVELLVEMDLRDGLQWRAWI